MIIGKQVPCGEAPLAFIANVLKEMDGARVCAVVPTSRNLRALAGKRLKTVELFSIKDFTSAANSYSGINIPKELRPYYLKKACEGLNTDDRLTIFKTENSVFFENLTAFVSASTGLLSFYRELAAEMIPAQSLAKAGKYTDHDAQIAVLERLWALYLELIAKEGYSDEWECYKMPEYRPNFIERYERFVFLIGGYLTKYELEQLKNLGETKDVTLIFTFTGAKNRHHTMYEEYLGITLSDIAEKPLSRSNCLITPCSGLFAQYEAITYEALRLNAQEDIDFRRMAVVIPDERVKTYFLRFDEYNLYDITSNEDIAAFEFFQILNQLLDIRTTLLKSDTLKVEIENVRTVLASPLLQNQFSLTETLEHLETLLDSGKIFISLTKIFEMPFLGGIAKDILAAKENSDFVTTCAIFEKYLAAMSELSPKNEYLLIKIAAAEVEKLALIFRNVEGTSFTEAADIIISQLTQLKSDTPKGKIAVTGILESRNLDFDVVFIPEMNEGVFPPANKKDLFLNTEIRHELGLPTFIDRENLLKNYLMQIINRSQRTFITYSKNDDEKRRSRIVEELSIRAKLSETPYFTPQPSLLSTQKRYFTKNSGIIIEQNDSIIEYLSKFTLSASSFDAYVSCPLKFYFTYVMKTTSEVEAEKQISSRTIGNAFHKTLEKMFKEQITADNKDYSQIFTQHMETEFLKSDAYIYNPVEKFRMEEIMATVPQIAEYERSRLNDGFTTAESEKDLTSQISGFRIKGRIDRIDVRGKEYDLIDYKFKAISKAKPKIDFAKVSGSELQLPFYAALFEKIKGVCPANLYYFDLQKSFKLESAFHMDNYAEFKEFMERKISDLKNGAPFFQTDELKACEYCRCKDICGR